MREGGGRGRGVGRVGKGAGGGGGNAGERGGTTGTQSPRSTQRARTRSAHQHSAEVAAGARARGCGSPVGRGRERGATFAAQGLRVRPPARARRCARAPPGPARTSTRATDVVAALSRGARAITCARGCRAGGAAGSKPLPSPANSFASSLALVLLVPPPAGLPRQAAARQRPRPGYWHAVHRALGAPVAVAYASSREPRGRAGAWCDEVGACVGQYRVSCVPPPRRARQRGRRGVTHVKLYHA